MITSTIVAGDVVVFGPPGVGKGTQCSFLRADFGLRHVSTGDLIRHEIKSGSPLGLLVGDVVRRGELVSDSLLFSMVGQAFVDQAPLLFDGFPRSVGQARWLLQRADELSRPLLGVVALVAPDAEIVARLSARRTCGICGAVASSAAAGGPCPKCGGELVRRADDDPTIVSERLRVYHSDTAPVLEVLAQRLPIQRVNGLGEVADVRARVAEAVGQLLNSL